MQRDLTTMRKWKRASLVVLGMIATSAAAGVSRITPGPAGPAAAGSGIVAPVASRVPMRKWMPASLVLLGMVAIFLAVGVSRITPGHAAAPATDPGIVLRGPGDVAVVTQVYEPGQSSGWHTHAGLHAVAVLAGELTIYDGECRPQRVVAGEPYVGGRELHLARNETAERVDMVVTYLNAVGTAPAHAGAPAGCSAR